MKISSMIIAVAAVVATASGCTAPVVVNLPALPVASVTPTPTGPPVARTYQTVFKVKTAAVENGFPCPTWTPRGGGSAWCGSDADGRMIKMFEWKSSYNAEYQSSVDAGDVEPMSILWGPGWIITSADYNEITALQARMGGEVHRFVE